MLATALVLAVPTFQGFAELWAMRHFSSRGQRYVPEWTFFAVNVPYWMMIACAVAERWLTPTAPTLTAIAVGTLLATTGVAVRLRCHVELRDAFSPFVNFDEGQSLVTTGLYRHIRHPMYLGSLLLLAGLPIIMSARWAWLFSALATVGIYMRVRIEEQLLSDKLPGYPQYCDRTWRLLPRIW